MKISLDQKPFFYLSCGELKAKVKQGQDLLEFLIDTKPSFYKDSLSLWQNLASAWYRLMKKPFKWIQISIKDTDATKTAYVLQELFEKQDFKQIIKKASKHKQKQEAKKNSSIRPKDIKIEQKAPVENSPVHTAPMLYTLDRVKIDKATSFEDLRYIAIKYLNLGQTSSDFTIINTLNKRLDELKKDPFGRHEKEVLHTLNIKYLNAQIPKLEISLKDIQEAVTVEQKHELLKKALHLPQDASFKMIQAAFTRYIKALSDSKDPLELLSINFLNELMNQVTPHIQTA